MKTYTNLLIVAILITSFNVTAEEINKWVDENGTVHFSDRAPQDKTVEVEKLENKQAPKQGLSDEELSEKKRRTHKYQNEVRAKHYKKNRKTQSSKNTQTNNANAASINREQAIKVCRNAYPNNTKLRTECFKQVGQQFTN